MGKQGRTRAATFSIFTTIKGKTPIPRPVEGIQPSGLFSKLLGHFGAGEIRSQWCPHHIEEVAGMPRLDTIIRCGCHLGKEGCSLAVAHKCHIYAPGGAGAIVIPASIISFPVFAAGDPSSTFFIFITKAGA